MDATEILRQAEELFQSGDGPGAILFLRTEMRKNLQASKAFQKSKEFERFVLKHEAEIIKLTDEEGNLV